MTMSKLCSLLCGRKIALPFLAIAISISMRADFTQSPTLPDGTYLNLDTGKTTTGTPAAGDVYDIEWINGTIVPQGNCKVANLAVRNEGQFGAITESAIRQRVANIGSSNPIPSSSLVTNDVFYAITNNGSASKIMVTSIVNGEVFLNFTTYQVVAPGSPVIKQILNNSSGIAPGLPNYGIAPSSIFVVTGSLLADPADLVLQNSLNGIPLQLNGSSITVVVNGVTTHPGLYYTSPGQLAAVLPANTPVGTGTLTVTHNGLTSAPASIQVVPSAVGINTYNTDTGVATDVHYNVFTFANSGAPGQIITLWATGLGADSADSDTTYTLTPHSVKAPLQVYVGGVPAEIKYQGSAGYPGVNQINIVIPDSAPTGCWVPVAAVTGTVISNVVTLPINAGGGPCFDVETGLNGSQLYTGGTISLKAGLVSLILSNTPNTSGGRSVEYTADASFAKYTGIAYDPPNTVSPGNCILLGGASTVDSVTLLDPGTISIKGPAGLSVTLTKFAGAFYANLPDGSIPSTGGTFTFTGTGGKDVEAFTSTLNLSSPLLTWTNSSSITTVNKNQGLHVTWTGGNPGTYVLVTGASTARINGTTVSRDFECKVATEAGEFTVPSYILQALPDGPGAVTVQNLIYAPLPASSVDVSTAVAYIGYTVDAPYTSTN